MLITIDEFVDNCMYESDVPIEGVNRLQRLVIPLGCLTLVDLTV